MMASFRYTNPSSQFVVLKLTDSGWERTLAPGQTITFKADPHSHLEIYSPELAGCLLSDRVPCQDLETVPVPAVPRPSTPVPVMSAAA